MSHPPPHPTQSPCLPFIFIALSTSKAKKGTSLSLSLPGQAPSLPVERALHQPVEVAVVLTQVRAQLLQDSAVDGRMRPPFGLMQAALPPVAADAVEALGLVEVEVRGHYPGGRLRKRSTFWSSGSGSWIRVSPSTMWICARGKWRSQVRMCTS